MIEEAREHSLSMEGREKLLVTGVTGVDSFNEEMVVLATQEGPLTILGGEMKIGRLNLEDGRLAVSGRIDALSYEARREKGSVWKRMFR